MIFGLHVLSSLNSIFTQSKHLTAITVRFSRQPPTARPSTKKHVVYVNTIKAREEELRRRDELSALSHFLASVLFVLGV